MKKTAVIMLILSIMILPYSPAQAAAFVRKSKNSTKIVICAMVMEALGKIADPRAKKLLLEGLKSKEFFVRAYAAQSLAALKDKTVIPELKKLINDKHYLVRVSVAKALLGLGDASAEKSLFDFINDADPMIRAAVVPKLDKFGVKFVPALLELLAKEKDPFIRAKIIEQFDDKELPPSPGPEGLGPAIDPRLAAIYNAMQDKDWQIRQGACIAIIQFDDPKVIPALTERLGDESVYVRATAKETLSKLGDTSAVKVFWQDMENKNPILKISSFSALANIKDLNVIPVLLKETVAPNNSTIVRREAARALAKLKPYVYKMLDDSLARSKLQDVISSNNLKVNYKVNGKDLAVIFLEALRNPKDPLYADSPFILAELKEEMAWPALRQALFSKDLDLVSTIVFVLGDLKDKDAVEDLIKAGRKYRF